MGRHAGPLVAAVEMLFRCAEHRSKLQEKTLPLLFSAPTMTDEERSFCATLLYIVPNCRGAARFSCHSAARAGIANISGVAKVSSSDQLLSRQYGTIVN